MIRAPPRLPRPEAGTRSFLTPPVPGIASPASGFSARKSIRARRSSSLKSLSAWREKVGVSATVCTRPLIPHWGIRGKLAVSRVRAEDASGGRVLFINDK